MLEFVLIVVKSSLEKIVGNGIKEEVRFVITSIVVINVTGSII